MTHLETTKKGENKAYNTHYSKRRHSQQDPAFPNIIPSTNQPPEVS